MKHKTNLLKEINGCTTIVGTPLLASQTKDLSYLIGAHFVFFQSRIFPERANLEMSVEIFHPYFFLFQELNDKLNSHINWIQEQNDFIELCQRKNDVDLSHASRTNSPN